MAKKPPRSSGFSHDTPASADGMSMIDDMSHAKLCLERLTMGEFVDDLTAQRALYQSALISFRRCIGGDARSMRRDAPGGGVVGRLRREDLGEVLTETDASIANRMCVLADDHVAHRQYIDGLRSVVADIDSEGRNRLRGVWNLPPKHELTRFAGVASNLHLHFIRRTAGAMTTNE